MPMRRRKLTYSTRGGHTLSLDDTRGEIVLRHSSGSVITIDTAGRVTVTANSRIELTATAVDIHAPITVADGVIQCTTLIASAGVVSPSYTPGVGNIQ